MGDMSGLDISVLIGLAGLIVGIIYQLNSRSNSQSDEKHGQHIARWQQHEERFVRSDGRIEKNEADISKTRDELHRDYVREDQLKEFRQEQHAANERMFTMLGALSRDLNVVKGELKAKRKSDERD